MNFAFIADLHLSRYSQDKIEDESNLPDRLHSIKRSLYQVGNYCYENDIAHVIIGGDIYHTKSMIYSIAQEIMLDFFEHYKDLEFWVLDGNHDLSGKGAGAISALRPISNCPNVKWISQTPFGDDNIMCIPYSHDLRNTS